MPCAVAGAFEYLHDSFLYWLVGYNPVNDIFCMYVDIANTQKSVQSGTASQKRRSDSGCCTDMSTFGGCGIQYSVDDI